MLVSTSRRIPPSSRQRNATSIPGRYILSNASTVSALSPPDPDKPIRIVRFFLRPVKPSTSSNKHLHPDSSLA
ncbi:hypothetical protein LshimejAT787_2000720 [Lyophyllum shimeji]|uniref:Uncharacterized protein n=1 Tax=Lyophyllum shimeji TaxID=47721 RepID=A0A9P3Q1N4_LYOSH|nr:hypothetical protein LshimejAT787_2000720 [Lyophyllum shimeji]